MTNAALKRGVRAVIHALGGIDNAAHATEKSSTHAGRWHSRNDPDLPTLGDGFAMDELALIGGARPEILHAWARQLDHVAIRLPQVAAGRDALTGALVDASAEFGDIATQLRDRAAQGALDQADRRALTREVDEAIEKLAVMRALLREDDDAAVVRIGPTAIGERG